MDNNSKELPKEALPPIPAKRYFTIGEVSELCGVKPHVLRYWEQEFSQLKPVKRRGNRRYYQHHASTDRAAFNLHSTGLNWRTQVSWLVYGRRN